MKSNTSASIDTQILTEARGVGLNISQVLEAALREQLKKPVSKEEREMQWLRQLKDIKTKVYQISQLKGEVFKKAIREAKFLGLPTETTEDKVLFWNKVLELSGQ
jgi:post-segregation antitoxin (ccd killing protein)